MYSEVIYSSGSSSLTLSARFKFTFVISRVSVCVWCVFVDFVETQVFTCFISSFVFPEFSHLLPPLILGLYCPLWGVVFRSLMTTRSADLSHFIKSRNQRWFSEIAVWLKWILQQNGAPRTRPLTGAGSADSRCFTLVCQTDTIELTLYVKQ